jgi:hypothetical protein
VLAVTEEILVQWRLIIETGRKAGHTFRHPDVLIAATAAQHGLAVVTRERSGFIAAGVPAKNPWAADGP